MDKYFNRQDAGQVLARALQQHQHESNLIILALPRGGVPVAFEIAKSLHAPLDVFIVRKLGVPGNPELAMGAIASGDAIVYNDDIIRMTGVTKDEINTVIAREKLELNRRESVYRGNAPLPDYKNKTIIIVDDGIATGASMRAAIQALRQQNPKRIIVAVPVADNSMIEEMNARADEVVCPLKTNHLRAVGAWYDDFSQTEDDEVRKLLRDAAVLSKV